MKYLFYKLNTCLASIIWCSVIDDRTDKYNIIILQTYTNYTISLLNYSWGYSETITSTPLLLFTYIKEVSISYTAPYKIRTDATVETMIH